MSISALSGPVVSYGQSPYPASEYNPELGPSLFFGGAALLDPRLPYTYTPGQDFGSPVCGFLGTQAITSLNAVPYTLSATAITAALATTINVPMVLAATSSSTTGVAVAQSISRADTGATVTGLLGIDAYTSVSGYVSSGVSGVAGNILTVTTATSVGQLTIGMVIAGTGIAAGTTITGYGPTTAAAASGHGYLGTYTVSGAPVAAGTSGSPITVTAALGSSTINALLAHRTPFGQAGTVQLWNPMAILGRAVSITPTSANPTASITFTVAGYDIYGYPMSEAIALTTGSTAGTAVNGKKAFKYIASVTPSATDTVTFSVGTTNIIGLPFRSDNFADVIINYSASLNPVPVTAATGYLGGVHTSATTTTGDVRGTYALQTAAASGANRIYVRQSPPVYNVGSAVGLFGVTQA
jgi:hypothetical protein